MCCVNDETYTVTGNELFATFPYEPHSNGNYHLSPCSFYGIQIDLKDRENLIGLNRVYSLAVFEILTSLNYRHLRFTTAEQQLLKMAFENISDGTPETLYLGVQYLCCFLFKIPDFIPIIKEEKKVQDKNIKRVLDFIETCFKDNIHLQELAVLSGYSLSRFKIKIQRRGGDYSGKLYIFQKNWNMPNISSGLLINQ